MPVCGTSDLTYSVAGQGAHPRYVDDTLGLPADGVIAGSSFTYHMASHTGNATLAGDWTEVANPTIDPVDPLQSMDAKNNAMFAYPSRLDQTYATTATLAAGQQGKYEDINFVLGGSRFGALNMRIVAVYADASEAIIYAFPTVETAGDIGPIIDDTLADDYVAADFNVVEQFAGTYSVTSGTTGNWSITGSGSLFEFAVALDLDETKDLAGIRLEDDADGDGDVDLDDFVILKSNFGASPLVDTRADFDGDGDIDLDDFVILKTNFGA